MAAPRPTLDHYRGDSLAHLILIVAFLQFWPVGNRDPRREVGSLGPVERLAGFEFWLWLQCLNPIVRSLQINNVTLLTKLRKLIIKKLSSERINNKFKTNVNHYTFSQYPVFSQLFVLLYYYYIIYYLRD